MNRRHAKAFAERSSSERLVEIPGVERQVIGRHVGDQPELAGPREVVRGDVPGVDQPMPPLPRAIDLGRSLERVDRDPRTSIPLHVDPDVEPGRIPGLHELREPLLADEPVRPAVGQPGPRALRPDRTAEASHRCR